MKALTTVSHSSLLVGAVLAMSITPGFAFESGAGTTVPNPVIHDLADSGMMRYNGEYYILGNWMAGRMLSSEDLLEWGNRTHVFSMHNAWATGEAGEDREIHACDLRYVDGVFHLYWSVNRADIVRAIGHATNTEGPMSFYTEPVSERPFSEKIDPHLFVDDDGTPYFYTTKFPPGLGNVIYGQRMEDPWTLVGDDVQLLTPSRGTWETQDALVNEAQWVFRYRDTYYMLYNANHTRFRGYAIGCAAQSDGPLAFRNEHKYPEPVLQEVAVGDHRITHTGQPSVVRGPNGFEWWVAYFASYDQGPRSIGIDRILFFDRQLFIDGPTSPQTVTENTYSPPPAPATFRDLFNSRTTLGPHWNVPAGDWDVRAGQARQNDVEGSRNMAIARTLPGRNYLVEANVRIDNETSDGAQAGVVAYYEDSENWLLVTLDPQGGGWRHTVSHDGVETTELHSLPGDYDFHVYRNLRVERNDATFRVWIDERPAPGNPVIETDFAGAGLPGLIAGNSRAEFDGFIYTIGWDEHDNLIAGWGEAADGRSAGGDWSVGASGLTSTSNNGASEVFKGDALARYEFIAQVTPKAADSDSDSRAGIVPVYVDGENLLRALIDPRTHELIIAGRRNGESMPEQRIALTESDSYNLRAIKHDDTTRIFVDGELKVAVPGRWAPSQVGLRTEDTTATFNSVTLFNHSEHYGDPEPAIN